MKTSIATLLLTAAPAFAQIGYTFEMRIIADGEAGSPGGPNAANTFPIGNTQAVSTTRIGFWLQARVSQTTGQNWGIGRASSPGAPAPPSTITLTDIPNGSSFKRGVINTAGTQHGRGTGYRNGGTNIGATGNTGVAAYPSTVGAGNGGLDGGTDGVGADRIYGFDAYVGATRVDLDTDGDGVFHNPFGINARANPNPDTEPSPVPLNQFAPWANLYRFWVDISNTLTSRNITINATALLNGFIQIAPTGIDSNTYAAQLSTNGAPILTANYTFHVGFCTGIDLGSQGGVPGSDGNLNNNDFILFMRYFFAHDPRADLGSDNAQPGPDTLFNYNDFAVFNNSFFNGCN